MKNPGLNKLGALMIAAAISAALYGSARGEEESSARTKADAATRQSRRPEPPKLPTITPPVIPKAEPGESSRPNALTATPFAPSAPAGTTLTGPATETYSGSSNALTITNSGGNRGISVSNSATSNPASALYGETYGAGAGLTGFNYGTSGPAGKFQILSSSSTEPAVYATTAGYNGPAVLATVTNSDSSYPAIYAQSNSTEGIGWAIRADASKIGVWGSAAFIGASGENTADDGYGVFGQADTDGIGVYGQAYSGYGVYAYSYSNYGVYAYSELSYAGYFNGSVVATSYDTLSDKNAKRDFSPVDSRDVLEKISRLPVSAWDFKTDRQQRRHIGPMAQDFYAAFHLNGDDDKHINVGDLAGVSLAAIQELHKELAEKDAQVSKRDRQIADLRAQLAAFSERVALIEQHHDRPVKTALQNRKSEEHGG